MLRGNRLAPGGHKNCAETDFRFFVSITVSIRYPLLLTAPAHAWPRAKSLHHGRVTLITRV
jgi:hypothetical protein